MQAARLHDEPVAYVTHARTAVVAQVGAEHAQLGQLRDEVERKRAAAVRLHTAAQGGCGRAAPPRAGKGCRGWLQPRLCDPGHEARGHPGAHGVPRGGLLRRERSLPGQYVVHQVLLCRQPVRAQACGLALTFSSPTAVTQGTSAIPAQYAVVTHVQRGRTLQRLLLLRSSAECSAVAQASCA